MSWQIFGSPTETEYYINLTEISTDARKLFYEICVAYDNEDDLTFKYDEGKEYVDMLANEIVKLQFKIQHDKECMIIPVVHFVKVITDENNIRINIELEEQVIDALEVYIVHMIDSNVDSNLDSYNAIAYLSSKFAFRLFELLVVNQGMSFEIDVDTLRKWMQFSEQYSTDTMLKYLSKAEDEIESNDIAQLHRRDIRRKTNGMFRKGKLIAVQFLV